jgi:NAD(P)-dependent dehydrogenase (short-subunit alcohol dehydrogenase family)
MATDAFDNVCNTLSQSNRFNRETILFPVFLDCYNWLMIKTVLVTGAEGILGAAVSERFLAAGVKVLGTYHRKPGQERPGLKWIQAELSDSVSLKAIASDLRAVDAWAHCAGGFRFMMTDQAKDEDIDYLLNSNLKSALLLAREIVPGMKERKFGRIVFVSSRATIQPPGAGMGAYAASKAGLNQLTLSLAEEVRSLDINVNAVLPTVIDTPSNRQDMPKADFAAWVAPVQLADIIFSLTQPWGKPIHGALLPVSGRL